MEKRHVAFDGLFEHLKSPALLPIGDVVLHFFHPGIIPIRGLLQILHHNLPHVIGQGWPLRGKSHRVNWARAQAFHNLLLIVETRSSSFVKKQDLTPQGDFVLTYKNNFVD